MESVLRLLEPELEPLIHFINWYFAGQPVGTNCQLIINHGDLYVMDEMAKGISWKRKNKYDLRHAAGCPKYTNL